jgi:protocatechuate 3,4-dioxygenase beta subunit
MNRTILTILLIFFSATSFAAENSTPQAFKDINGNLVNRFEDSAPSVFNPKAPTPSRFFAADLSMPESFATTNNLAKKTGSFYRAFGEIIFIQGTVTDSFNVPIDGAVIEIWQKNAAGKYHTLLERDSEFIDKYFSMSGRTVTDNLGNYHFITVMPGAVQGRAPHINMNIYHPRFGKLETEMYFEKHPYNENDYQYLSYKEDERKALTAVVRNSDIMNSQSIKLCTFDIVMQGVHQYKKF